MEWPSHLHARVAEMLTAEANAAFQRGEPFVIYGARVFADGNQWCAILGEDIQVGVCGFGDTPAKAVKAFNAAWHSQPAPKEMAF
jgi:hypothetical protein